MSFRYPAHPNTDRTDPFRDATGKNPFADAEAPAAETSDNPYAAPAAGEPAVHPADAYQLLYPHRGRTVLWLGVLGFCGACGTVLAAAGLLATRAVAVGILIQFWLPLTIASLTASGIAWMFGRLDAKAMRAGAMDPAGLTLTQRGGRLGVAGTWMSLGTLLAFLAGIVR